MEQIFPLFTATTTFDTRDAVYSLLMISFQASDTVNAWATYSASRKMKASTTDHLRSAKPSF